MFYFLLRFTAGLISVSGKVYFTGLTTYLSHEFPQTALGVVVISPTKVMGLLKTVSAGFGGTGSMLLLCERLTRVVVFPLRSTEHTFRAVFRRRLWMSSWSIELSNSKVTGMVAGGLQKARRRELVGRSSADTRIWVEFLDI